MSAPDAVDERQRITRSAPTAHRVAVAVIAARVAFDPLGFGGRRAGVWEDALARAPRRVDEDPARATREVRAAHAKCAADALAGGEARERSATETTAKLREALEDATAGRGTEDDGDARETRETIVRWGLERFLDEMMEVSESLDDLEAFFEDARCVAANARAEDYEAEYGFETRDVEGWTPIGMFLKRCYLGFNLLPFEATLALLDEVRAYAEEVARAIEGDENEPPTTSGENVRGAGRADDARHARRRGVRYARRRCRSSVTAGSARGAAGVGARSADAALLASRGGVEAERLPGGGGAFASTL